MGPREAQAQEGGGSFCLQILNLNMGLLNSDLRRGTATSCSLSREREYPC